MGIALQHFHGTTRAIGGVSTVKAALMPSATPMGVAIQTLKAQDGKVCPEPWPPICGGPLASPLAIGIVPDRKAMRKCRACPLVTVSPEPI
jgi:hypothetical protein